MLFGLENTKNTSYTEVTRALKNLLLIFNSCFTKKNQEIRNQKFDFVWLFNIQFGSIAELNPWIEFDIVQLSSIEIQNFAHSATKIAVKISI